MREAQSFVAGAAIGAGIMFLLEPRQSGARRARIRDKSVRAIHELEHAASIGARDLEHRVSGAVARIRGNGREETVDDRVLEERVRSVLGRHCSHPHAVRVIGHGDGLIELEGPILASDLHDVLHSVRHVPGVEAIDDSLEVHESADGVPALQGGRHHHDGHGMLRITPAEKLVAGVGLGGIALSSLLGGHMLAFAGGMAGVLALARSINARSAPLFSRRHVARPNDSARREDDVADPNPTTVY